MGRIFRPWGLVEDVGLLVSILILINVVRLGREVALMILVLSFLSLTSYRLYRWASDDVGAGRAAAERAALVVEPKASGAAFAANPSCSSCRHRQGPNRFRVG